jgi:hypothetical protein
MEVFGLNVPATQRRQFVDKDEAKFVLYVPIMQSEQTVAAYPVKYFADAQSTHVLCPAFLLNVPTEHETQEETLMDNEKYPGSHAMHV